VAAGGARAAAGDAGDRLSARPVARAITTSHARIPSRQCLDRRIPNKQILIDEIAAWEHDRNTNHTKADWQFTTKNTSHQT
jgi:hypothetical protein